MTKQCDPAVALLCSTPAIKYANVWWEKAGTLRIGKYCDTVEAAKNVNNDDGHRVAILKMTITMEVV